MKNRIKAIQALEEEFLAGITYDKSCRGKCFESAKLRPGYVSSASALKSEHWAEARWTQAVMERPPDLSRADGLWKDRKE